MAAPVVRVFAVLIISSMVIMEVLCYPSRIKRAENMENGLFQDPNGLTIGRESGKRRATFRKKGLFNDGTGTPRLLCVLCSKQ